MARILGRVWRQAREHERAERECISEEERKGEDGKCEEDSPPDGRSTFSFSAKAKEGEEDATATKRTPFEPWAQKLAHWSPGYCINAAGTEVIFAPKCNEGGGRERYSR